MSLRARKQAALYNINVREQRRDDQNMDNPEKATIYGTR